LYKPIGSYTVNDVRGKSFWDKLREKNSAGIYKLILIDLFRTCQSK